MGRWQASTRRRRRVDGAAAVIVLLATVACTDRAEESSDTTVGGAGATASASTTPTTAGRTSDPVLEVEPAEGLADGQLVSLSGTGFTTPGVVAATMCVLDDGEPSAGDCEELVPIGGTQGDVDVQPYREVVPTDGSNAIEARAYVRRVFTTSTGEGIDCTALVPPRRCAIAVGLRGGAPPLAAVEVGFDPSTPVISTPTATVDPAAPYTPGESVEITVGHTPPGTGFRVQTCVSRTRIGIRCAQPETLPPTITSGDDGLATLDFEPIRTVRIGAEAFECDVDRWVHLCLVRLDGAGALIDVVVPMATGGTSPDD